LKVFLLADIPTRERVEFLDLLGKQCDLTVAFEQYHDDNSIWHFSVAEYSFKTIFLSGFNFGTNANLTFGVGRIIKESPYDVYVIGDYKSSAEKTAVKEILLSGKRFVFACEGGFPEIGESKFAKNRKAGYIKSAAYYLSSGSACDAYLKSYNVNMSRVYRYNYATFSEKDYIQATPMTLPREKGLKKRFKLKENVFISTLDFNEEQGIDILLDVWKFAAMDNSSLLLISDAGNNKKLYKMAQDVALNDVVMIDYQPRELTRELIKLSKAYIYPARYDKWGLPVVEALSCGTPVISSYNVGAVHDLVNENRTGYVRNINEPISWGECMRDMIERNILYNKMKNNISSSMRLFTVESRVKTYMEVLKKCAIVQTR